MTKMDKHDLAKNCLLKAIKYFGSQKKLAEKIDVNPGVISYGLNYTKEFKLKYAIKIERVSKGKFSRYDLSPHAREDELPSINAHDDKNSDVKTMKIMDKIKYGIQLEKNIRNRKGRPKSKINCPNLDNLIEGRTDQWIADQVELGSKGNFIKGKYIFHYGIYAFFQAINEKRLSIDLAYRIAYYDRSHQGEYISLAKKDAIKKINEVMKQHKSLNTHKDFISLIAKDETLKTQELKTNKSIRGALITLAQMQQKNISLDESNDFFQKVFHCSVEECIQIFKEKNLDVLLKEGD